MSFDNSLPEKLKGAVKWANSPVATEMGLLRVLSQHSDIRDEIINRTAAPTIEGGRPLMPGHWGLAYLCFVASREATMKRWHQSSDDAIWLECGFTAKPRYDALYRHFVRLEGHADDFRAVASKLMGIGVEKSDGKVGQDVSFDGTEAETNARPYRITFDENGEMVMKKLPKAAVRQATAARQRAAKLAPEQEAATDDLLIDEVEEDLGEGFFRTESGLYYSSDPTARPRRIDRPGGGFDFWLGYNANKAIDIYTGGVLAINVTDASVNESDAYPALLNQAIENTGRLPRAVNGDKGLSVRKVYETNTRMGITSAFPHRPRRVGDDRSVLDCDIHDMHGVPKCAKCGASTEFEDFRIDNDRPRLWYSCPACDYRGTISCSKDWTQLLPMWRTEEAYLAIRRAGKNFEAAHERMRDRFLVGPKSAADRPRRRGIDCQQLRAQAALLLEWLTICLNQGWLGDPPINTRQPTVRRARGPVKRVLLARRRHGLHLPTPVREAHQRQLAAAARGEPDD